METGGPLTVSVVIPCRNEARSIGALLDAIAGQSHAPTEILIVDDRSTDSSATVIEDWMNRHPDVALRLVTGEGRGPGPAMNAGITATTTEVVVRLDAHCVPDPHYIEYSLRALGGPNVGVAGGVWRVRAGADTAVARAIAAVVTHPLGSGGARYRHPDAAGSESQAVETVPFGAFRRTLWERIGGYDETLEANQDFDLNYRVRLAGLEVILDRRIKATYLARPTLVALWRQYVRYGFWKSRMLRKDARAIHWRQVLPIAIAPWVIATAVAVIAWPDPVTALTAAAYPAVVLVGGLHLMARGSTIVPAMAALATVHLGWSVGFWRERLGGRPPTR